MSVLGLNKGYMVKGKGLYLTVYPLSRPNTNTVQCIALQCGDILKFPYSVEPEPIGGVIPNIAFVSKLK